jgi:hypothetical protein
VGTGALVYLVTTRKTTSRWTHGWYFHSETIPWPVRRLVNI